MSVLLTILGFILTFPLKASIKVLQHKLNQVDTEAVADKFIASRLGKKVTKTGGTRNKSATGKSEDSKSKLVKVLKFTIARLQRLLKLIKTVTTISQVIDILIVIVIALLVLFLLSMITTVVMFVQDDKTEEKFSDDNDISIVQRIETDEDDEDTSETDVDGSDSESSKRQEWIKNCSRLGTWYAQNIKTYQGNTSGRVGTRKGYLCPLIKGSDGHTVTVYDDCSAFVTACLQLSGYYRTGGTVYCSYDYLKGGKGAKVLESAGFEHIGNLARNKATLKRGDILAIAGHVEIFSHYSDDYIYSWSWGAIYSSLPVKRSRVDKGYQYTDIWRLKEG